MFSYNAKTGNLIYRDKRIVRWEMTDKGIRFWYKDRGAKWYFLPFELKQLAKTIRWFIEKHGSDFGEDVNTFALTYPDD